MTAVDVDALAKLREAALTIRQMYPSDPQIVQNETDVEAEWSDGGRSVLAECYGEDIAALIVAAVNAIPDLIAAVRERDALREAVEALADLVEQGRAWTGDSLARRLRAVVAAVDPS